VRLPLVRPATYRDNSVFSIHQMYLVHSLLTGGVGCVHLWLVVQEAQSYHKTDYWINRARVRLDSVNWDEGASRLTMDLVSPNIPDIQCQDPACAFHYFLHTHTLVAIRFSRISRLFWLASAQKPENVDCPRHLVDTLWRAVALGLNPSLPQAQVLFQGLHHLGWL